MEINNRSIAILLAAYNGGKYLKEQLDSVLRQTIGDWTLYIRDDGSTDGTAAIIEDYCARYPDKIMEVDKGGGNLGCSGNFFRLLEIVESDYYMFCDQDDVWMDDKCEVSLAAICDEETHYPQTPVMAFGDLTVCDTEMNPVLPSLWQSLNLDPERFLTQGYVAVYCTPAGAGTIFNHRVKERLFPLAESGIIYDHWIALVVAGTGRLRVIKRPLRYYRLHGEQVVGLFMLGGKHKESIFRRMANMWEFAGRLRKTGYGPRVKYFWYKLAAEIRRRTV